MWKEVWFRALFVLKFIYILGLILRLLDRQRSCYILGMRATVRFSKLHKAQLRKPTPTDIVMKATSVSHSVGLDFSVSRSKEPHSIQHLYDSTRSLESEAHLTRFIQVKKSGQMNLRIAAVLDLFTAPRMSLQLPVPVFRLCNPSVVFLFLPLQTSSIPVSSTFCLLNYLPQQAY